MPGRTLAVVYAAVLCTSPIWLDPQQLCAAPLPDAEPVLSQAMTTAAARLELAEARWHRQRLVAASLQQLAANGQATYRETAAAQTELRIRAAYRDAARKCVDFLTRVASDVEPGRDPASAVLVVSIPGLAGLPDAEGLATVCFPLSPSQRRLFRSAEAAGQRSASSPQVRMGAWRELERRLAAIDDGSAVAGRERELAAARRAVDLAAEKLRRAAQKQVRLCRRISPMTVAGVRINSEQQLLAVVEKQQSKLQLVAEQAAAGEQIRLHAELIRRAERAAHAGASPPAELPALRRQLAAATRRQESAAQRLRRPEDNSLTSPRQQLVSAQTSIGPFTHLSLGQVEAAIRAAQDQLHHARHAAAELRIQQLSAAARAGQLRELAARDAWFDGEHRRAELLSTIAVAEADLAEHRLGQRQLELDFLTSIRDARTEDRADSNDWKQPLLQLFRGRAASHAAQKLARRTLQLDQWRLDQLRTLRERGHATWKEVAAARVRRDESQQRITEAAEARDAAQRIVELLRTSSGRLADGALARFP